MVGWFVIVFHFLFVTEDTKRNTVKSNSPNQTIDYQLKSLAIKATPQETW